MTTGELILLAALAMAITGLMTRECYQFWQWRRSFKRIERRH